MILFKGIRKFVCFIFFIFFVTIFNHGFLRAQPVQLVPGKHLPGAMVINPQWKWTKSVDAREYHGMGFQLSFDFLDREPLTYIWSSYKDGGERLYTTTYENGRRSRSHMLSAGKGIIYQPVFISHNKNAGWAFWQRKRDGKWEIVGRRQHNGIWEPIELISEPGKQALFPDATVYGSGVAVVWEDHSSEPQRIKLRIWNGSQWESCEAISQQDKPSYRPALTTTPNHELWIVWDCYEGFSYSVYGKRARPDYGELEKISETDKYRNNLKPVIIYGDNTGLITAWISVIDVAGGAGVLGQWNSIRVAARENGDWQMTGYKGERNIADLRHSLLPSVEPPDSMWGFAGRRRHPMLIENNGNIWLLWERKIEHTGFRGTPGELCARKFNGKSWSEQLSLHSGMVKYHVPSKCQTSGNILTLAAMNIQNQYYSFNISLDDTKKLKETSVTGWNPVKLPLHDFDKGKSVIINGKRYFLYWGDLHVHTGLSADAEGEVDEMMHYARDKAKIDVVVLQDNDAGSWLNNKPEGVYQGQNLTEAAYQLSVYYSRKYNEPGRFIALTGWEWTDVTDDGLPNHRTVIFAGDDTPILRHTENKGNFMELCDAVEAAGGVMNTQHAYFQLTDRSVDANIEVVSAWGNYLDPPDKIYADLSNGFKVGFVGNSDGHRQIPGCGGGLTGIYATELSRESILEAIKSHRVYATNGNRMFVDARANGVFMGNDVESNEEVELNLKVEAPEPLVKVTLIRDGNIIFTGQAGRKYVYKTSYTDSPGSGFHWYYWEIQQEGSCPDDGLENNMKVAEGHLAWTSPHRVFIK